ncbi:neutral/alkaline non-lysosomal ceramidase N-terminal domain-containing protein [Patulibacter minatonensis]|uniref:neutral/alkaline non-lysosomal ceramidase N-terminal domain-containing protein n=1 Tax=Patulibacter minatonensis TaxID=298163 RepID=UPI00047CC9EE|nr:neutral/alkaline non-lysosomal ceramidase N-terminal domain-containing protein [Patulibacter minatonensis]
MTQGRPALRLALLPAALVAALACAPVAAAHSEAEEAAEEVYAAKHPAKAAVTPAGSDAIRLRAKIAPPASYAATAAVPGPPKKVPAGALRAGVGRADLTPPRTGYFLGGWTRADRVGHGVSTRLTTSAIVLEKDGRRVALVAMADFAVPQGLQQAVAAKVQDLGLNERTVILSATHTHSGTGGFANTPTLNTAAPGAQLILSDPTSLAGLVAPSKADPQLYTFIVDQVATAIRRAAGSMGPAAAAWGHTTLSGLTRNRSLVARLADFGTTDASKVPYAKTINPSVDVLRVDRLVGPTCTPAVRRAAKRATTLKRRATAATRTLTRARRTARSASSAKAAAARRAVRTAQRRSRAAARAATRARTAARRAARRSCAKDGRLPIGGWSNFANHGTVVKSEFGLYSADHGGVAAQQFEALVRRDADVPAGQPVIAVYGNADEGDMSAGLDHSGPAGADLVGRTEGDAFYRAWQDAGPKLSATPAFDVQWTRFCFCGRTASDGGKVAVKPQIGAPFLTGSEEGRGPLFDITGVPLEGTKVPAVDDVQGDKLIVPIGEWSEASPMVLARIGDGAIVTMPGEATIGVGERTRANVLAQMKGVGVNRVTIAGLANDYLNYITTPEEYDTQQYEGASTVFGRHSGTFLADRAGDLGAASAGRAVTLEKRDYDASNGVRANGPAYPQGSAAGRLTAQPGDVRRLGLVDVAWQGAPSGGDKPLDSAFVTIERQDGARWVAADNDLGTAIAWRTDADGKYVATWNPPETTPLGTYRVVITAPRYTLTSKAFRVLASDALEVRRRSAPAGRVAVQVGFPLPRENVDLIARPTILLAGTVDFRVGDRTVSAPIGKDGVATVEAPAGTTVTVPVGAARDPDGNVNGKAATASGGGS